MWRMCRPRIFLLALACGCGGEMAQQAKLLPLQESGFFPDKRSARPLPGGTVAHGSFPARADAPPRITLDLLKRGRERFDIHCAVCHGYSGHGDGMVVRRGFPAPASYHSGRLRAAGLEHFFLVITNGYGRMFSYAERLSPEERWAVAAYIRALQRSQHASLADVPAHERRRLEARP